MKKLFILSFLLMARLLGAQIVDSDTIKELSEITIVASRIKTLPGSGQIIRQEKIARLNQPDINKVLRTLPGVNIRDEEGFGLRPNIGLRGTQVNRSAKITLMEDGVLAAPAPYSDPAAYYFPTFSRIESVEVLKGSSQIKHGPYTIGGAINLISTSIPNSFKGFAQISTGSFGTGQQRVWVGDSRKNFDYLFEVNRLSSNGFKELDGGGNTGFDRRDFMGKLRWHSNKDARMPQSLTLKFLNMSELGNESYLGLTYEDFVDNPNRRYAATRKDILNMTHAHISLQHAIRPAENLHINSTAYYTTTFRDWGRVNTIEGQSLLSILNDPTRHSQPYRVMTGIDNGQLTWQSAARTFETQGIQSQLSYAFQTGQIKYELQAGIRYHKDEADRYATQSVYAMQQGEMILTSAGINGNRENQLRQAQSLATFVQVDMKYRNLTLSPGLRREAIQLTFLNYGNNDVGRLGSALQSANNELTVVLPGLGLHYRINDRSSGFGGVHQGFSPPGMPSLNSGVEQARVETAQSYELGYRYNDTKFKGEITGFWNRYENILGSDNISGGGAGTGDMFNAGRASVKGVELSLEYDLLGAAGDARGVRLPLSAVYTFTDARFGETFKNGGGDWGSGIIQGGDLIPFITPNLLTVSVTYEAARFNATVLARHVGRMRTTPGQDAAIIPADGVWYPAVNTIDQYQVVDLSANYTFWKQLTAFTLINNIFNQSYIVANLPQGYRPGMPLAVHIGLKAAW